MTVVPAQPVDPKYNTPFPNAGPLVQDWVERFNQALTQADTSGLKLLFEMDSHWRNVLGIGWRFATISGRDSLCDTLHIEAAQAKAAAFVVHPGRLLPAHTERAGEPVVESAIAFQTREGQGLGLLRLRRSDDGQYRAWSLFTALEQLHGVTARDAARLTYFSAPAGPSSRQGPNWLERRNRGSRFDDKNPQVIVVGGGHNGISAAVELDQLGVDTLVVDAYQRVGDNWRQRYHSLSLHNKTPSNHLPYLPFPKTFPDYIPKDKIANWLEFYADSLDVNIWTDTRLQSATRNSDNQGWTLHLLRGDGSNRVVQCAHVVMATSTSGLPSMPDIPGLDQFGGDVIHSSQYADGRQWRGRDVSVFGTGTSAHDICQDLHGHGARVTMVQRSPTMIVNLEPSAQLYDQIYYNDGPPLEDRDLINASVPLPIVKKAHKILTEQVRQLDAPLLAQLAQVGFELEFGEDNTGWPLKYRQRGGGYYFNVGCSELIASRAIDLIQYRDIQTIGQNGLTMVDGSHRPNDLLVMATGYHGQDVAVRHWFGDAVADKVGKVWGFDETTQELCNMWTKTAQDGLWFTAGAFSQARIYSKYLAMQVRAELN
ncbi:MAG: NAD(P)/FAD-dependent oxidoreductase [Burkholderiaceae bacterium]